MDVKQLIRKLSDFDTNAIVTVGDDDCGWSNIKSVVENGSSVKIVMSDNVVFSDDRAADKGSVTQTSTNTRSDEIALLEEIKSAWWEAVSSEDGLDGSVYNELAPRLNLYISQLRAVR